MLDIQDIKDVLPHRYPFLLVDRILEIEEGKRVVGVKNVTINEVFFNGHFPDQAIMPGVLILEAMAQVGGVLILTTEGNENKFAYLTGIDKAKFRKPVVPGDQLYTEATIIRLRGNYGKLSAKATVEDRVVAEAEFFFILAEKEQIDERNRK